MSRCLFGGNFTWLCVHFTFVLGGFHRSLRSFCYFVSTYCIFLANCLSSHIMFWPEVTFMTFTIKDLYVFIVGQFYISLWFLISFFLFWSWFCCFFHHILITALKVLTCFVILHPLCTLLCLVCVVFVKVFCLIVVLIKKTKDPWRRNIDVKTFWFVLNETLMLSVSWIPAVCLRCRPSLSPGECAVLLSLGVFAVCSDYEAAKILFFFNLKFTEFVFFT